MDQDVQVAGEARHTVKGQGIGTNDDEIHLMIVEQREQFSEVFLDFQGTAS